MKYPVTLIKDKEAGGYTVTFPDVPEAITEGDNVQEAMHNASEALEVALSCYIDKRLDIPKPSHPRSKKTMLAGISALSEAKVGLYLTMRDQGVRKAELARRLGWQKSQVDRLLDLNHSSRLEQIEQALRVLGKQLVVQVQDAA